MPRTIVSLIVAGLLAACTWPGPEADEQAIASIERYQVYAQGRAHEGVVSYLHAGTPEIARVVLVHAAPGEAAGWADFLLNAPDGQEYIAPDRPGYGESRPDGAVVALAAQADALRPFLEPDTGASVILVEHARGAPLRRRSRPALPGSRRQSRARRRHHGPGPRGSALGPRRGTPAAISWLLPRAVDNANRERLALADQLRRLAPRLARIERPAHIIHGVKDERAPYANVDFMRQRLRAASVHVTRLENGGHFLPWTSFAVLQTRINTLVARICGGLRACPRARRSQVSGAD